MGITKEEWQQSERAIIDKFFRVKVPEVLGSESNAETACTEDSCVQFGKRVLGANDLVAVDNQGCNSFTLVCHSKSQVIQFRLRRFDTAILDLAHQIYGSAVPRTIFHSGFRLPVYTSKIIPGKVHLLQPFPEAAFPLERQKKTVTDLGRFIARATYFPQPKTLYNTTSWTAKSKETLEQLRRNSSLQSHAPEITAIVSRLWGEIDLIDRLPAVLTHHDFSEVNILVDEAGNVTGVIDFDVAGIEAFGTCIWGIYECFLGSMEQGKWSFHNQEADGYNGQTVREVLETAFYASLWSNVSPELQRQDLEAAVKVALSIGIINRYFIRGMMDEIDLTNNTHRLSLEYAKGILPTIWGPAFFP
ncbi:MAG: hypothetical protein M1821_009310 [Bathelium mastoideum]|nr:MAG: hypothetical protein M1821_009310 [Bathelium mastoideum]